MRSNLAGGVFLFKPEEAAMRTKSIWLWSKKGKDSATGFCLSCKITVIGLMPSEFLANESASSLPRVPTIAWVCYKAKSCALCSPCPSCSACTPLLKIAAWNVELPVPVSPSTPFVALTVMHLKMQVRDWTASILAPAQSNSAAHSFFVANVIQARAIRLNFHNMGRPDHKLSA